jgi:Protein of unknown function (DUF669)
MSEGMEPLDFSAAEEVTFEPLPKGTYECTVYEAEMTETSGSGKLGVRPMLRLTFKVQQDEQGDTPEEYVGRNIWTQFVVPPKELDGQPYKEYNRMMGNMLGFFRAIGYAEKDIRKWKKFPDPDDYTGRACAVQVKYVPPNEDKGWDARNEVKQVKPAGSSTQGGVTEGGLGSLA